MIYFSYCCAKLGHFADTELCLSSERGVGGINCHEATFRKVRTLEQKQFLVKPLFNPYNCLQNTMVHQLIIAVTYGQVTWRKRDLMDHKLEEKEINSKRRYRPEKMTKCSKFEIMSSWSQTKKTLYDVSLWNQINIIWCQCFRISPESI